MRFVSKHSRMQKLWWSIRHSPRHGFTTNKFLWFPVTINGETRWLERTKILWRVERSEYKGFINNEYSFGWEPYKFK